MLPNQTYYIFPYELAIECIAKSIHPMKWAVKFPPPPLAVSIRKIVQMLK
jgi:hypothetical protein